MVKAKVFIFAKHFDGMPKVDDFDLVEEELPELKDQEFLVEAICLSVDPYMRPYSKSQPTGQAMLGSQVARVIKTRNGEYPLGTHLVGYWGWRTHTVVDPRIPPALMRGAMFPMPDLGKHPRSLGLGAVGMPGNTAYFGFLEICQPKAGEVVVVSGAAGAVGSLVGQIAKIKGCYVIGYAGSDDKVDWLLKLGFDKAYNYKTVDWNKSLDEAAPNGVDCYFDNVGGTFSTAVRKHMNEYGRISVCGAISMYNDDNGTPSMAPGAEPELVFKQLKMEGFLVHRWMNRWLEGLNQMLQWIDEGKIQVRETVTQGFDNMPKAFIDMLQGGNTGKAIIYA